MKLNIAFPARDKVVYRNVSLILARPEESHIPRKTAR